MKNSRLSLCKLHYKEVNIQPRFEEYQCFFDERYKTNHIFLYEILFRIYVQLFHIQNIIDLKSASLPSQLLYSPRSLFEEQTSLQQLALSQVKS